MCVVLTFREIEAEAKKILRTTEEERGQETREGPIVGIVKEEAADLGVSLLRTWKVSQFTDNLGYRKCHIHC